MTEKKTLREREKGQKTYSVLKPFRFEFANGREGGREI